MMSSRAKQLKLNHTYIVFHNHDRLELINVLFIFYRFTTKSNEMAQRDDAQLAVRWEWRWTTWHAIGLEAVDHTHAMSQGGSGHHHPQASRGVLPSRQHEASVDLTWWICMLTPVLRYCFDLTCLTPLLGGFTCLPLCLKNILLDHLICFSCLKHF